MKEILGCKDAKTIESHLTNVEWKTRFVKAMDVVISNKSRLINRKHMSIRFRQISLLFTRKACC